MRPSPDETELVGRWQLINGRVRADATCERIEHLVSTQLIRLGSDASGWDELFRDPFDGRLWERTYPDSDSEGGGPPRLACISRDAALEKYGSVVGGE
jgi:hypothetical protein